VAVKTVFSYSFERKDKCSFHDCVCGDGDCGDGDGGGGDGDGGDGGSVCDVSVGGGGGGSDSDGSGGGCGVSGDDGFVVVLFSSGGPALCSTVKGITAVVAILLV
jgi:hypothetical protein